MPLLLGLQRNILMLTQRPLYLDASTFRVLLEHQGPSLGLWRATEIAVLREVTTYYSQVPTTVLNNVGTVDGHALDLLAGMIERYVPETIEMKANTL